MINVVEHWGGCRNVDEAVQRVRDSVGPTVEDENMILLIALERAAFVASKNDCTTRDIQVYGELRHEVLKRMSR